MYLKTDRLIVTLGGIKIYSHANAAAKFFLDPSALKGWTDTVDIRRDSSPRPISDGDFSDPAFKASRQISISGYTVAKNAIELHTLRDDFAAILADNGYAEISVEDIAGVRTATVGLASRINWAQQTDNYAIWKLELYAPDPRVYGVERRVMLTDATATGGLNYTSNPDVPFVEPYFLNYPLDYGSTIQQQTTYLTNVGNVTAWPVFTVTGDFFSGFSITDNLGNFIVYNGAVSMQAPVTIDTRTGSASQSGSDRTTFLSKRDWFGVPPKKSIQPKFNPIQGTTGWCDILYRDTWI